MLEQRNGDVRTTRLRSLDPTTALTANLFAALAAVALDRAESASKEYTRKIVKEYLCDALTVGRVRADLADSPLASALESLKWPNSRRVLHNTCSLVGTLLARRAGVCAGCDLEGRGGGYERAGVGLLTRQPPESREERIGVLVASAAGVIASALTGAPRPSGTLRCCCSRWARLA